jgi:hypothetical protein
MTEAEWLACTDPTRILEFLGGRFLHGNTSERQRNLRLFNCACCRRIWHLLTDERSRKAVEIAERYADGLASDDEADNAMREADQAWRDFERDNPDRHEYADRAANCGRWAAYYTDFPEWGSREARLAVVWEKVQQGIDHRVANADEQAQQCVVLRDIFGNPFRRVAVDPSWLTPSVVGMVRTVYDDRAFDRMPQLADALERAGCTNADLLSHCRQLGEHVRGCWLIDLLNKK